MKKKTFLFVGLGSIGKRQLSNFIKYAENIDICDSRKDRLREVKKKFSIRNIFETAEKALNNTYDAIFICTPPSSHLKIAKLAVKKNINIFIEKPMGINSKGWSEVFENCKKKKLINYIDYCHRFIPYTQKLKKIILKEKAIGKIYSGHIRWSSYLPYWHPHERYTNFYMSKKHLGGGALLDDSHGIDLIRYLFGDIKSVMGEVKNLSDLKMTSDDSVHGIMNLKNKILINMSFELYESNPEISLKLVGSKGSINWDRVKNEISIYSKKNKKYKKLKFTQENLLSMYPLQAKYFMQLLEKKQKNNINNIKDAMNTQKTIDAFFKSSKLKKLINV